MRRGKRVYYRKERDGARVRSVYCGSGERGERAAREDEERRAADAATLEKARTLTIEKARTSGDASNAVPVAVIAVTAGSYPESSANLSDEKKPEKARTLAAPRPMVPARPSSPLRVMGRPVGAAPRPRNYEEWRRSALRSAQRKS